MRTRRQISKGDLLRENKDLRNKVEVLSRAIALQMTGEHDITKPIKLSDLQTAPLSRLQGQVIDVDSVGKCFAFTLKPEEPQKSAPVVVTGMPDNSVGAGAVELTE